MHAEFKARIEGFSSMIKEEMKHHLGTVMRIQSRLRAYGASEDIARLVTMAPSPGAQTY